MGIALALLIAIGLIQHVGSKKQTPKTGGDATLFQGLELNAIDSVEVSQDSNSVQLMKKDGQWVVKSLYDYPANFRKLADALRAASEVKLGRPQRTANVDATEYGFDHAKSIVMNSGGKEAVKIEVGAQREASESAGWARQHFIRKDGKDPIYLVDYDFRPFNTDSDQWIDTELLNISPSDIVSVSVGDVALHSVSNTWTLADLNEATEEFQTTEANRLRSALQYLNCSSIADPALELTNAIVYTASTSNKTYTVSVGAKTDDGRLVQLGGDVPDKLKPWTYVISSYKADSFLIPREQLVKVKKEEVVK